jgi:hypothetical protein
LSPQQSKFVSDCCVRKYLFINLCFIIRSLWLGVNDHTLIMTMSNHLIIILFIYIHSLLLRVYLC